MRALQSQDPNRDLEGGYQPQASGPVDPGQVKPPKWDTAIRIREKRRLDMDEKREVRSILTEMMMAEERSRHRVLLDDADRLLQDVEKFGERLRDGELLTYAEYEVWNALVRPLAVLLEHAENRRP